MTERKPVNPWTWQDQYGFSQAIDVRQGGRVLYCAGQTSVDDQGNVLHAGDMAAQIGQALDNLDAVLRHAGLSFTTFRMADGFDGNRPNTLYSPSTRLSTRSNRNRASIV